MPLKNKLTVFIGFVLVCLTIVGGQLLRFNTPLGFSMQLLDITVLILSTGWLTGLLWQKKSFPTLPLFEWWATLFVGVMVVSLINGLRFITPHDFISSALFLIRWIGCALLIVPVYQLSTYPYWRKLIIAVISATFLLVAILGLLQIWLMPDFGFYEKLGWDPHQHRLLSTFFDPNFVGGFLVIGFAWFAGFGLTKISPKRWWWLLAAGLMAVCVVLTFSRSALLALIITILILGAIKSWKLLLVSVMALGIAYGVSPRLQERVMGAIQIDATAQYRIKSWSEAYLIIKQVPIIGVGYNTLEVTKNNYFYVSKSHAGSGFDSSLLTIATTTGLVGLAVYLIMWLTAGWWVWRQYLISGSGIALGLLAAGTGLFTHSIFVNSLLYPPIMIMIWSILALVWSDKFKAE